MEIFLFLNDVILHLQIFAFLNSNCMSKWIFLQSNGCGRMFDLRGA